MENLKKIYEQSLIDKVLDFEPAMDIMSMNRYQDNFIEFTKYLCDTCFLVYKSVIYNPDIFYDFYLKFTQKLLDNLDKPNFFGYFLNDCDLESSENVWHINDYNGTVFYKKFGKKFNAYYHMDELLLDKILICDSFDEEKFKKFLDDLMVIFMSCKELHPKLLGDRLIVLFNRYKKYIKEDRLNDIKKAIISHLYRPTYRFLSVEDTYSVEFNYDQNGVWTGMLRDRCNRITNTLYRFAKMKCDNGLEICQSEMNELEDKIIEYYGVDTAYLFMRDIPNANIEKLLAFVSKYDHNLAKKFMDEGVSYSNKEKTNPIKEDVPNKKEVLDKDNFLSLLETMKTDELKIVSLKLKFGDDITNEDIARMLSCDVSDVDGILKKIGHESSVVDNNAKTKIRK